MTRLAVGTMALLLLGLALPAGDAGAAEIKLLSPGNMANIWPTSPVRSNVRRATSW